MYGDFINLNHYNSRIYWYINLKLSVMLKNGAIVWKFGWKSCQFRFLMMSLQTKNMWLLHYGQVKNGKYFNFMKLFAWLSAIFLAELAQTMFVFTGDFIRDLWQDHRRQSSHPGYGWTKIHNIPFKLNSYNESYCLEFNSHTSCSLVNIFDEFYIFWGMSGKCHILFRACLFIDWCFQGIKSEKLTNLHEISLDIAYGSEYGLYKQTTWYRRALPWGKINHCHSF